MGDTFIPKQEYETSLRYLNDHSLEVAGSYRCTTSLASVFRGEYMLHNFFILKE